MRRLARELDLDLTKVSGSGEKGRITKEDVKKALTGGAPAAAAATGGSGIPEIPTIDFSKFGPIEDKPLSRIRKLSGPFLHRSWLNVPAVTQHDEADITELEEFSKKLDDEGKAAKPKPYRVSLLPFLIRASVAVLKQMPGLQLLAQPGEGRADRTRNTGTSASPCDTPEGLVVPVIKDADKQGRAADLDRAWRTLGQGARRQIVAGGNVRRDFHHFLARRHWRHRLHADRQCAGSGDPRRGALENGAGLERQGVQAAADAAFVAVL